MPAAYYTFDEANKHKRLWNGAWSKAIWVDDAGLEEIAVIHWMGGAYKVVGRYRDGDADKAKAHAERCSAHGYCPTTPADAGGFRAHLSRRRRTDRERPAP